LRISLWKRKNQSNQKLLLGPPKKVNEKGIKKDQRVYYDKDNKEIPSDWKGEELPAYKKLVKPLTESAIAACKKGEGRTAEESEAIEKLTAELKNTKIFTPLPKQFYYDLTTRLMQLKKPVFPTMYHPSKKNNPNKGKLVKDCIALMEKEDREYLSSKNFNALGWGSEAEYDEWLKKPALFAFTGTAHYATVSQVIQCTGKDKAGRDVFRELTPTQRAAAKKINILSLAAFEFRGFDNPSEKIINDVKEHAETLMKQILNVANKQGNKHIVLMPFGMGVFLGNNGDAVKPKIIAGWKKALKEYNGDPLTIHCCLMPAESSPGKSSLSQFEELKKSLPAGSKISLVNKEGHDALTVAAALADEGEEVTVISGGDDDWIFALDNTRMPGQCHLCHDLYGTTSDEYYALMTTLAAHSLQNLQKLGLLDKSIVSSYKRKEIAEPEVNSTPGVNSTSTPEVNSTSTPVAKMMESPETDQSNASKALAIGIPGLTYIGLGVAIAFMNAYASAIPMSNIAINGVLGFMISVACFGVAMVASKLSKKNDFLDLKKPNFVDVVGAFCATASTVGSIYLLSKPEMVGDAFGYCGFAISGVAMIAQWMLLIANFAREETVTTAQEADTPNTASSPQAGVGSMV
jgi:hypothetical protein